MGVADDEGERTVLVVARVRLPVALIFDVIRTLNDTMTEYESVHGQAQDSEPAGSSSARLVPRPLPVPD